MKEPIKFSETYFSRFPITNTQFCSFLNSKGVKNEEDLTYKYLNTFGERCHIRFDDGLYKVQKGYEYHPCVYVNWYGCKAFCDWLGVKLPDPKIVGEVINNISESGIDLDEVNLGEKIGRVISVLDMNYRDELLNLVGNTWKWTDSPEQNDLANEYGGAFNSSKHVWNLPSTRHKRFGASNLGFQVVIPQEKINELLIPQAEISNMQDLFQILSQDEFRMVKNIFFDLDGTLHDFRTPSRTAMNEVYEKIINRFSLEKADLQKAYGEIFVQAEKEAFREGRTSHYYRTERFTALLKHFSIEDVQFVDELVKTYGDLFEANLKIESSIVETLRSLSEHYKLYLVTEGPLDAQIRTVEKLGIKDFFAKIFTSGQYGKVKETGHLFDIAQKDLDLKTDSIVIVGDNPSKDIRGANLVGIKSILAKVSFTKAT